MLGGLKLLHTIVLFCSEFVIENLCTIFCALTRSHGNVLCINFVFHFSFYNCFSGFVENSKLSVQDVCKINNEDKLVRQLENVYRHGKEIYPKQSAKIFHKLG